MNTMGDYTICIANRMYSSVLADVFEEFRNVCLHNYDLDAWCYTAPGLAWDAALKESQVKLYFLTDVDMLLMIAGKGIAWRHLKDFKEI